MSDKYSTIHQHEPLRTPGSWGTDGRRYTAQLEAILDDLYSRLNRLGLKDLSKPLRESIVSSAEGTRTNTTAILQTGEELRLFATQYTLDMAGKLGVNDPAKLVETEGSTVVINKKGIDMSGGSITLKAGTSFTVISGGVVQIDAADGEGSYINLGDAFSVSKDGGVTSQRGSFEELTCQGADVVTTDLLPARVVVSGTQPEGNGVIWLEPSTVTSVAYKCYTGNNRTQVFSGSNLTRTYTLTAGSTDVFGSGQYHYSLSVPFTVITSGAEKKLHMVAVLHKNGDNTKKVTLEADVPTINAWDTVTATATADSGINLCESDGSIILTLTMSGVSTPYLYLQRGSYIRLNCRNKSVDGALQSCIVHYIP